MAKDDTERSVDAGARATDQAPSTVLSDAFARGLELHGSARAAFVERFGEEHPELSTELSELLMAASEASDFLAVPPLARR